MDADIPTVVKCARQAFQQGRTRSLEFRRRMLTNLVNFYQENTQQICEAIHKDLRKHSFEVVVTEISYLVQDCQNMLRNLTEWTRPFSVKRSLATLFDRPYILPEPYGLVLVFGAWNYPLQLVLAPIAGAICAGNCVVIKPSEVAPATAQLLSSTLGRYLDPECFPVVLGGRDRCCHLLEQQFDYIFYTGGASVGRIVGEEAARHLTPVTLELGGKSPVYLDSTADLQIAVRRVMWGKCLNAGQTCIAPDYLLTDSVQVRDQFVEMARTLLVQWFGESPIKSSSLGRIVNEKHFQRVKSLMETSGGKVAVGGTMSADDLFISPTILVDVSIDSDIMREEIFGPVLPILLVKSAEHAAKLINKGPSPLAFYVFSRDSLLIERMVRDVRSGGITVNDVVVQVAVDELPFGGVGDSGLGRYHGKCTFDTFTHYKSVLQRGFNPVIEKLCSVRYPPYTAQGIERAKLLLKNPQFPGLTPFKYALVFSLGFVSAYSVALLAQKFGVEQNLLGFH